jgi:3-deoxy-D-manno-octulosonic-acid transferase
MHLGQMTQRLGAVFHEKLRHRYRQLKLQSGMVSVNKSNERRILVHSASYGEFEQIKPLIEKIKKNHPDQTIILSFFSPSGYYMAQEYEYADEIYYLPIDTKGNMIHFIKLVSPSMVILVKYEVWLNFTHLLVENQIPVYLVSAIFFREQIFFKSYGRVFRRVLHQIKSIYVQDKSSFEMLNSIQVSSTISGDTRADRVHARSQKTNPVLSKMTSWTSAKDILILGSVWPEDWAIFKPVLDEILQNYRLVVAPHEIHDHFMETIKSDGQVKVQRWTSWSSQEEMNADILVVDTVGILADVYRYGHVAYIGGGFKQGLHNVFEPAVYGLPIFFGPDIHKFGVAKDLVELEVAFQVSDSQSLLESLQSLRAKDATIIKDKLKHYVHSSLGSTDKIYNGLKELHDE